MKWNLDAVKCYFFIQARCYMQAPAMLFPEARCESSSLHFMHFFVCRSVKTFCALMHTKCYVILDAP